MENNVQHVVHQDYEGWRLRRSKQIASDNSIISFLLFMAGVLIIYFGALWYGLIFCVAGIVMYYFENKKFHRIANRLRERLRAPVHRISYG